MPPRPAATDLLECFEIARCVRPPIADAFLTKFGVESRKKPRFLVVHQTARCNSTLRRKGLHSFSLVRAAHARVAAVKFRKLHREASDRTDRRSIPWSIVPAAN